MEDESHHNKETTKKVVYSLPPNSYSTGLGIEPPKKIKKIAETDEWAGFYCQYGNGDSGFSYETELSFLDAPAESEPANLLCKLLSTKRQGYKSQDIQKNLFEQNKFISVDGIRNLLVTSRLICFYCNLPVKLIYKYARDPKQWSLERVDNSYGHNTDNVVIACLDCNVRRRTMFQERYKKTKEMYNVVKLDMG
jgi:hypothetical protein